MALRIPRLVSPKDAYRRVQDGVKAFSSNGAFPRDEAAARAAFERVRADHFRTLIGRGYNNPDAFVPYTQALWEAFGETRSAAPNLSYLFRGTSDHFSAVLRPSAPVLVATLSWDRYGAAPTLRTDALSDYERVADRLAAAVSPPPGRRLYKEGAAYNTSEDLERAVSTLIR